MKISTYSSVAVIALAIGMTALVSCNTAKENKDTQPVEEVLYTEGIDKGIEKIMADLDVIGLGVAVVKGDEIVYKNSWGYKNLENQTPLQEDDLFRIASISKSFTATSIMQLVEKGALDLDADVSDLVGFKVRNPKFPDVKITPYMLLSHTSSLNDAGGYFKLDVINPEKNADFAKSYNDYRPGTQYEYCNLGYNTLGTIIERVSKIRFDQYVVNNVLKPIGIDYAGYWVASLDSTKFVSLYQKDNEGKWEEQKEAYAPRTKEIAEYEFGYSTPIFSPTGGMKINPVGLAKVMQMHMGLGTAANGAKVLGSQSALLMQSRFTETGTEEGFEGGEPVYYGFALWNNKDIIPGKTMVGHTGGAYGVYTIMLWNKERTFGIVSMTNGCSGKRERGFMAVHNRVVNCLYQNLIKGTEADK
ncbi:MAG: beta-lactamase family protein [Bacteroidales bacterium]|nr:beta-lactamase family protein [Bacteroidales bacterium]